MSAEPGSNPFRGLAPFAEQDAALFFGRETESTVILANLMATRFTVVYGRSGVGKSSLLRAGVEHGLRELGRENLRAVGTPQLAVVVFAAWRDDPLPALLRSIRRSIADAWNTSEARGASDGLEAHLDAALQHAAESVDGEVIVILDQLEELFHNGEPHSSHFVDELARAIGNEAVRASFLVGIRDDALAALDSFSGRMPYVFSNLLRIEHLDRDAARQAIEAPVDVYNQTHTPTVRLEPALVEAVLDQVRIGRLALGASDQGDMLAESAATERVEAPYLQLVMERLWQSEVRVGADTSGDAPFILTRSALEQLGGAEHIVHTHLDSTMETLTPRERTIAAQTFSYLVTPSGTKIAHSAVDLAAYASVAPAELEPVLGKLAAARILLPVAPPPGHAGVVRYEVFHDLLAGAILDWRRRFLRDAERELTGRQLAVERHRVWHLRRGVISLSVLLLVVIALALIAIAQTELLSGAQQVALSREASQRLDSFFLACFVFGVLFTLASALLGVHGLGTHAVHVGHGHTLATGGTGRARPAASGAARLLATSSWLAFLTWFGAAGYLLERFANWVLWAVLLGAVLAGAVGWYAISRFMDLVMSGEREMDPDEYRLEGTIARVTVAIPAGGTGEVVFSKGGVRRSEAARAGDRPIPRGADVLITHYSGGFATVEPWTALVNDT